MHRDQLNRARLGLLIQIVDKESNRLSRNLSNQHRVLLSALAHGLHCLRLACSPVRPDLLADCATYDLREGLEDGNEGPKRQIHKGWHITGWTRTES